MKIDSLSLEGRRAGAVAVCLCLAALALRLVGLSHLPPGLFVDEAFTGYDALSLLHTGRDMWGEWLPVYFASWGGDAVEGLYRYLCVPFLALLGPVPLAVRLPAALAGAATVGLTFLAGRRLLGDFPAVMAAGLLAVSPWHVPLSRVGFRAILLPAAAAALVWLAMVAVGKSAKGAVQARLYAWPAAALVAGLGLYSYAVAKLFLPMLVLLLVWVLRDVCVKQPRRVLLGAALLLLMAIPAARWTWAGRGQVRFQQISVFAPQQVQRSAEALRRGHPDLRLAHWVASHPALTVTWTLCSNYLSHFHPRYLLTRGDENLRHSPSGVGQMFWVEGTLLLLGVAGALWRRSLADRILLGWFLLGPLADSLTNDRVPNALRSLPTVPAAQLLAASGFLVLWAALRARRRFALVLTASLAVGLGVEVARYQLRYFTTYAAEAGPYWNAAYAEGVQLLLREAPAQAPLRVLRPSDAEVSRYALNASVYSLLLFYGQVPPEEFQATRSLGRARVVRLATELPSGAWALLPSTAADPRQVRRWVQDAHGQRTLAIVQVP